MFSPLKSFKSQISFRGCIPDAQMSWKIPILEELCAKYDCMPMQFDKDRGENENNAKFSGNYIHKHTRLTIWELKSHLEKNELTRLMLNYVAMEGNSHSVYGWARTTF